MLELGELVPELGFRSDRHAKFRRAEHPFAPTPEDVPDGVPLDDVLQRFGERGRDVSEGDAVPGAAGAPRRDA